VWRVVAGFTRSRTLQLDYDPTTTIDFGWASLSSLCSSRCLDLPWMAWIFTERQLRLIFSDARLSPRLTLRVLTP